MVQCRVNISICQMVRSFLHELLAQFNTDDLDVQVTVVNSGQRRSAESEVNIAN